MWTITLVCIAILASSYARNEDQVDCGDHLMRLLAPHTPGNQDEPPTCLVEAGGGEKLMGLVSNGAHILESNHVVIPRNVTAMVTTISDFAGRNADFKEVLTEGCRCNITLIELLGPGPFSDAAMSEYNQIEAGGIQPCTDLAKLLLVN